MHRDELHKARPIKLLGLEIDRKTDVLALAAFLVGLGSVVYQFAAFLKGSELSLLRNDSIILYGYKPSGEQQYLTIVATMGYVNTAQPGFNDAVMSEAIVFNLDTVREKPIRMIWHKFVRFSETGDFVAEGTAKGPVVVLGGAAEVHETWFAGVEPNFVRLEEVAKNFRSVRFGAEAEWKFSFAVSLLTGEELAGESRVIMTTRRLDMLQRRGWVALDCIR